MLPVFFIATFAACTILFLGHWVLYKTIVSVFAVSSFWPLAILKIVLICLGGGFIAAMTFSFYWNNALSRIFYTVTASWYGFFLYLFLAAVSYWLLSVIFGGVAPALVVKFGRLLILASLLTGVYGLINAQNIQLTRYQVSLPNLPASWRSPAGEAGKKIIWLSDVHLDEVHGAEYSKKIVSIIEKENPDLVFIGGDLYDGTKVDENAAIAPFKNLHSKEGVYFVTGNHEEFGDRAHFINAVQAAGIKVLDNQMVNIDGVNIIGVDDRDSSNQKSFENILAGLNINKNQPVILLKHRPTELDIAEKYGVSLQISGHTHRAQLWPLSYIPLLVYKGYAYGQKNYGEMQVITSSGVGTWGPPLRVGTKSEILVITFK